MTQQVQSALGMPIMVNGTSMIFVKVGEAGYALYGPYVELPAGTYHIGFHVEAGQDVTDLGQQCGTVDVCGHGGLAVIAAKAFTPADLQQSGGAITLAFTLSLPAVVEFRVITTGTVELKVMTDRTLSVAHDVLFSSGTASAETLENPGVIYTEFVLQNIGRFKELMKHGAQIKPVRDGAVVSLSGINLHVQNTDDFQIIIEILLNNAYAFSSGRPTCVIDVGMNVGLASLYFASLPFVSEIHSFEPFQTPYGRAVRNFGLNSELSRKIKPHNFGLSDKTDKVSVLYTQEGTIGASIQGLDYGIPTTICIQDAAPVFRTILCDAKARNLIVAAKLDCEGSEFPIFETLAADGLLGEVDIFLIEWHKWWSLEKTQADLVRPLLDLNFFVIDQTSATNPHAGQLYAMRSRHS